jgi:hypothetical protein
MSETLREEEGHDQVAEDEDAEDQADQVLGGHSRSVAFRMRKISTKRPRVRAR